MNILMATRKGLIKRISFDEFKNIRKSGIIGITLKEDDSIIGTRITKGENEVILVTKKGMSIRFAESDIRKTGRSSMGVKSIDLNENDEVIGFDIVDDDKFLLVISEKGFGKMTLLSEYRIQTRAGKGIITYKIKDKTGDVISAKVIDKNDEIMMITSKGVIIRIGTEGISVMGRSTSGVKLMNIKDSDIVAVAKYIGD